MLFETKACQCATWTSWKFDEECICSQNEKESCERVFFRSCQKDATVFDEILKNECEGKETKIEACQPESTVVLTEIHVQHEFNCKHIFSKPGMSFFIFAFVYIDIKSISILFSLFFYDALFK